jgi:hypothetical protein
MKNNKLTLASLKAELENLKTSKSPSKAKSKSVPSLTTHKSSVAHDIKNSYIQNLHMKSSMFMLWIVTAVLSYAHKIPFIKQIISVLSLWYGRTTIWKVLIKLRKMFIIFNAIIGIFMVYKTVGFNHENLLAGFSGMGHSYLEIFINFNKRLFNWVVELFDHKVVPNITKKLWNSGTGPIDKSVFNPFSSTQPLENSLRKSYNSLLSINIEPTPWYRDLNNLWWVGGLLIKGAAIAGVVYFGYKFIIDPLFIESLGKGKGEDRTGFAPAVTVASPEGSITPTNANVAEGSIVFQALRSSVKGLTNNIKKLNPAYWFITSNAEEYNAFLDYQKSNNFNSSLYPHTKFNPYDTWMKRMRIHYLGETVAEQTERRALKYDILNAFGPITVGPSTSAANSAGSLTPQVATVGLGLTFTPEFAETAAKLYSVSPTPGMRVLTHVMSENLELEEGFNNSVADAVSRLNSPELDDIVPPVISNNN